MKRLIMGIPLALILCFMVGCQDKEAMEELEAMKDQAEVEEQNKVLVKRFIEGLNNRNANIFKELYAPDYVWYFPSSNPETLSWEEELEFGKSLWAAFPDITYNIDELIAVDDRVIVRFHSKGTHQAAFAGITATGYKFEATGIWIARISNGKLTEVREEYDLLGFYQQLGMELKPKEGEK